MDGGWLESVRRRGACVCVRVGGEAGGREKKESGKNTGRRLNIILTPGFSHPSRPEGDLLSGINLKINKLVCVRGYGFTVAH